MARPPGWLLSCCVALLLACAPDAQEGADDEVAVRVATVMLEGDGSRALVVLAETRGTRRLPIWIGGAEAESIASRLRDEHPPRPNSHDLARRLIDRLDAQLARVVVTDLREGVYFARLHVVRGRRQVEIDARPSDAIALALRLDAPLFVRDRVFLESQAQLPEPVLPWQPGSRENRQVEGLNL